MIAGRAHRKRPTLMPRTRVIRGFRLIRIPAVPWSQIRHGTEGASGVGGVPGIGAASDQGLALTTGFENFGFSAVIYAETTMCSPNLPCNMKALRLPAAAAIQARCGCSSMVERELPKLQTRVRFPSPAP